MLTKQQYNAGDDDGDSTDVDVNVRNTRLSSFSTSWTSATRHTLTDIAVLGVDASTTVTWVSQLDALINWFTHCRPAAVIVTYQPLAMRAPAIKPELNY